MYRKISVRTISIRHDVACFTSKILRRAALEDRIRIEPCFMMITLAPFDSFWLVIFFGYR